MHRIASTVTRCVSDSSGDVEAPLSELMHLPIRPDRLVVVENFESGLALPELEGTVAAIGLGNAVSVLGALPWAAAVSKAVYWGDIDTHGFVILDRARRALPGLESVLMDEATLMAFRPLWGQEPLQSPEGALTALTESERQVHENLRVQTWGLRVRLEQERIPWAVAVRALEGMAIAPPA